MQTFLPVTFHVPGVYHEFSSVYVLLALRVFIALLLFDNYCLTKIGVVVYGIKHIVYQHIDCSMTLLSYGVRLQL